MEKFDDLTIEHNFNDFSVIGHTTYEKGSVLEGQYRRCVLGFFLNIDDALKEHPSARVIQHNTFPTATVADLSPQGFDTSDIGEIW